MMYFMVKPPWIVWYSDLVFKEPEGLNLSMNLL
nr:MAG TPA: hypothetical protein [Caudoviricetes sp.]